MQQAYNIQAGAVIHLNARQKQSYMFVRVYLLSLNTVHTRYVHHEQVAAGVPKYCHNKHNKLVIYCECTHKIYNNLNILDMTPKMTNEATKSHTVYCTRNEWGIPRFPNSKNVIAIMENITVTEGSGCTLSSNKNCYSLQD